MALSATQGKKEKLGVMEESRPYAQMMIQVQLLNDIAGLVNELTEAFKETIPDGVLKPLNLDVGTRPSVIDITTETSMPWMSFIAFNDGASSIFITVNKTDVQEVTPLRAGENVEIAMKKKQISRVLLHTQSGTATVRIFAVA